MLSPKLETERLILRRFKKEDIDLQYEIITDKRLAKYVKFPAYSKEQEFEGIKKQIAEADESKCEKWVITLKNTGKSVGNISVNSVDKKNNYCNG